MKTYTDKAEIEAILHGYMLRPKEQSAEFLFEIRVAPGATWNGRKIPAGGLIIEGPRPFGCSTALPAGEKTYSLTNSDSNYTRLIGTVNLSDIVSVTTLH